jgi:hypothetical protein
MDFPKYEEVAGTKDWFGKLDFSQEHGDGQDWPEFPSSIGGAVRESKKEGACVSSLAAPPPAWW